MCTVLPKQRARGERTFSFRSTIEAKAKEPSKTRFAEYLVQRKIIVSEMAVYLSGQRVRGALEFRSNPRSV